VVVVVVDSVEVVFKLHFQLLETVGREKPRIPSR